jgi:hypothetical protein
MTKVHDRESSWLHRLVYRLAWPVYDCEDCVGMRSYGCYCAAHDAVGPCRLPGLWHKFWRWAWANREAISSRLLFEPRDLWVGLYVDAARRRLYVLPLPTLGVVYEFGDGPWVTGIDFAEPGSERTVIAVGRRRRGPPHFFLDESEYVTRDQLDSFRAKFDVSLGRSSWWRR